MEPINISSQVNIKKCFQCQGTTEYYCHPCQQNLCKRCHAVDLDTDHHHVTAYREKYSYLSDHEICREHKCQVYETYCKTCDIPVCSNCLGHISHKRINIRTEYKNKRNQSEGAIVNIRSNILYCSQVLLNVLSKEVKVDVETCRKRLGEVYNAMTTKSKILKKVLNNAFNNPTYYAHRYLIQRIILCKRITRLQNYEQRHEQSANRPVQFLRFIKRAAFSQYEDLIELMNKIKIIETGKRKPRNEDLLKTMSSPTLQRCFVSIKDLDGFFVVHISCMSPHKIWVTDSYNLTLTDTEKNRTLHIVKDALKNWFVGFHTVSSDCELIYIDDVFNINKFSQDMKQKTTYVKRTNVTWDQLCVHCCLSTGDLLVGMSRQDKGTDIYQGQIKRYSNSGQLTQTIPHCNTSDRLYRRPLYITENNNGDIVVSDSQNIVVVTDNDGRHRFTYTGTGSQPIFRPNGVCTDALSHILVSDGYTETVHIIDKDGQFLSYLLSQHSVGIECPLSLTYDYKSHLLWVGSGSNTVKVSVYRYINRDLALS